MLHILTDKFQVIDPLFGRKDMPIELDLGCGKGKFTLELASRFPEHLILGADIMLRRLRKISKKAVLEEMINIELLRANNLHLASYAIPDNCIDRIHILCPDPWPKNRHRSKRLFTTDFFTRIARILKPNGCIHIATDHEPYHEVLINILEGLPFFEQTPERLVDISDIKTDFELVWLAEGKNVPHLCYSLTNSDY